MKSLTLDDDWLVMPLPEVDETMVPLPRTVGISMPDVVTVDVPPRAGSGHVSPEITLEAVPFVVIVEFMPVARPLNSWAVTIWALPWALTASTIAALIQKETRLTFPLFIGVLL